MRADTIIKNSKLLSKEETVDIALKDGKIAAIGTEEEIRIYDDENVNVVDAGGNSVIPAFIDAHMHASSCTELYKTKLMYGFERADDEKRQDYIDRMMAEIKTYCNEHKNDPIIRVVGWNPAEFQMDPEGEPTCRDIDKICSDRPLTMRSYDHHYLLVNSKALEMAGITKDTPDPSGGMKVDAAGDPTGLFREMQAINLVFDNLELADFSVEEYKEGLISFQEQYALPNGIAGIFDAYASRNAMEAYRQLAHEKKLKIRVRTAWLADPAKGDEQFDIMIQNKGKYDTDDDFRIETIKFFCDDGAFGFYMNEPFESEILKTNGLPEDYRGSSQWTDERLKAAFLKLSKAGFQIHVHCMGDAAVRQVLDGFEYVNNCGVKGNRDAIAHIFNIDDRDVIRMSEMGVIASMQPSWPLYDSFAEYFGIPMMGEKRILDQYPLGRLKKAGVVVAAGTDFPVMTMLNPFVGIQIGVTRKNPVTAPDYQNYKDIVCGPADDLKKDCMRLSDMIQSYTASGAYEMFIDDMTGSIEVGKSADLLILDRDLEETDEMELEFTGIDHMILKGEIL